MTEAPVRMPTLLIWGIAGLAGLLGYAAFESVARPGVQTEIEVGRAEAAEQAQAVMEQQGFDLTGLTSATVFRQDTEVRTFLEKEFDRDEVDRIVNGDLPVFHWYTRWFAPGQLTDYRIWIRPDGTLSGFSRRIPDDAEGVRIDAEAATALARQFVDSVGRDLTGWSIHQQTAEELTNRTDHSIIWEQDDFAGAPAYRRLWVDIQGDVVGSYYEYVQTPEAWDRTQSRDNAWRGLLQQLSGLPYNVLLVGIVGLLLLYMRTGALRYRFGLLLALLVACVDIAASLNNLPTVWISYPTNQPVTGFWLSAIWQIVLSGIMTFFMVAVLALVAEVLGRGLTGTNARIADLRRPSTWARKDVLTAVYIGYGLMGLHLAYNTFFYIIGRDVFGVWSPQPSIYSNLLSTPFPFLYPLTTGLSAAVHEELAFRLIAIALLYRMTRSWSIAVVLPAVVWAFQHSLYPQDPFYIRGVELTIVGIAYGLVFLRYGLVATLVSHFGYNAVVSSEILLSADALTLQLSGAFVCVVMTAPLWPAALQMARGRGLTPGPEPVTAATPELPHPPFRPAHPALIATESNSGPPYIRRLLALAVASFAIAMAAVYVNIYLESLDSEQVTRSVVASTFDSGFRPEIEVTSTRESVRQQADAYLTQRGVDPTAWHSVVGWQNQHGNAQMDYLYQRVSADEYWDLLDTLFAENAEWYVRYYRPEDPESFYVYVLPDETIRGHYHSLPEDAPGATLSQEEARAIAEDYLRNDARIDFDAYVPADSNTSALENRTDHWFAYEWTGLPTEVASIRLSVWVLGDEPMYPSHSVEVPNTWTRARSSRDLWDYALAIFSGILVVTFGIAVGGVFVHCFVSGAMPWRKALPYAFFMALLDIVDAINELPFWWQQYPTETNPIVYSANGITGIAYSIITSFAVYWGLFAFAAGLLRLHVTHGVSLKDLWTQRSMRQWAEGYLRSFSGTLAVVAVAVVLVVALFALAHTPILEAPDSIRAQAPTPQVEGVQMRLSGAINKAVDATRDALVFVATAIVLLILAARYFSTPKRFLLLYGLLLIQIALAYVAQPILSSVEFVAIWIILTALFWGIYFVANRLLERRLTAHTAALVLVSIFVMIDQSAAPGPWFSVFVCAMILAAIAAAVYLLRTPPPSLDAPPDHLSS